MKKKAFGIVEVVFDLAYLIVGAVIGIILLSTSMKSEERLLAGALALVLILGDSFHLFPRIMLILTKDEQRFGMALGIGKQITSITMTVFYVLLWHVFELVTGLAFPILTYAIYALAIARIALCCFKQNGWTSEVKSMKWAIWRNVPFFVIGCIVSVTSAVFAQELAGLKYLWLAIALSFAFYLPVVLFSHKNPKIGMLMLPKTCCYVWILAMLLSI